ncbi:MAG: DNA adenine methylase [Candidatus Woesearchaeota archaeon]
MNNILLYFLKNIKRYFEPFVGGGAIFFYILQKYWPKEVLISDINEELINAYNVIKTDVDKLIIKLKEHKKYHEKSPKEYFYNIRALKLQKLTDLDRAARFIYLNKTCFNGLYRVNSKSEFNVPMGQYKNPSIVQAEKLKSISKLLTHVQIKAMPFEKVLELTKKEDFIYFDPPYYPLKVGKSFTTYTSNKFLEAEQRKLAEVFKELDKKGCKVMLSNSDTGLINSLYNKFNLRSVEAKRVINSVASKRGKISEIIVTNY